MDYKRILLLGGVSGLLLTAMAIRPKTEWQPRYYNVTDVERTDSALRVSIRLQNRPNWWVSLAPTFRIIATEDTTLQYHLKGAENIELGKRIWMPESGYHDGVLVFEKVPESVKVVDMVESKLDDAHNNVFGICLDEEEDRVRPNMVTLRDITANGKKSAEIWSGLDPSKYSDLSYYDGDGQTHIRGCVADYTPRCGNSTVTITTYDDFTGKENVNVGKIDQDGNFAMDVPVHYPQFDNFVFGHNYHSLFLIPGDTVSIVTCLASRVDKEDGYVPEYFGFEGNVSDAVAISVLADSLINRRYGVDNLYGRFNVANSDSMRNETYRAIDNLGLLLDSVVADLPKLLGDMPVSSYAKDMLSAHAISKIAAMMENLEMNFRYAKGPGFRQNEDGTYSQKEGEILDLARITAPKLRHKQLMFDNPLLLCNTLTILNRWETNALFSKAWMSGRGQMEIGPGFYKSTDDYGQSFEKCDDFLDSIGVKDCFPVQLVMTKNFINGLNNGAAPSSEMLERARKILPYVIKRNESAALNDILMNEFNEFVKNVMIAENAIESTADNSIMIEGTEAGEIFQKIIKPYKGNVLYIDFWGIGCGPCRQGMKSMKPLLEELSEKPFRALYIANASEGLDECKQWLKKEEIKGEHIFVSNDEWRQLQGLFNFNGIPFGVLVGKDGKVIKAGYHSIYRDDPLLKKALEQ